ncbi:HPP family protein [Paenibacillus sedimenti]|uniref:HPP family protein n=1 Tax=Paenibacillus sedimenti TaxID=2770274 RepID=A0A926KSU1_9BACL|nr:HPP family protein [Paenibacillus sedimenti]MBD0382516.1 hypothetical protein [Paenibacillus sedimenti]
MLLRSLIVCFYLVAAYWASYHFPSMKMVFYPTLGAFSFLFMHRVDQIKDLGRIIIGAMISVTIGSLLYSVSTGAISFFVTAIITIWLIQFFKWNAAPIMSVSLIPYFAHPASIWALPAAVLISLVGLLVPILVIGRLEQLPMLARWSMALQSRSGKWTAVKKEL